MALIFFFILFTSVFLFYHLYYKRKKLPPGPIPLPFIGNLLQIHRYGKAEDVFLQWRHQFGPMYTFWIGHIPVVCVAEYAKIVDTFVRDGETYAGRYTLPFEHVFKGETIHGVIRSSGERWREQRRFALHVLRDFGLGKNLMQERIMLELRSMFGKIDAKSDNIDEVNLQELVDVAVGSIINNLMFGYRFEVDKEREFWDIKHSLDEHFRSLGSPVTMIWGCYPHLVGGVPPFSAVADQMKRQLKKFFEFFERRITEHQRELDKCGDWEAPPNDFVEAFLKEMKRKNERNENGHYFDLFQCTNMCFDLWIAGQETTATTLAWGIAQLLNNQKCLDKLYAELDMVIGTDRLVSVADRPNLPYTNAVINETLRIANIVPNNVLHALTREVTVDGFKLPKGTAIVPQVSAVLFDDTVFSEPRRFKPERFLENSGKCLARCDELIPFSIGKRQCLGESLARMELFLFIANIFNQYKVSPGKIVPSLQRNNGAVVHCSPFTCRMEKRSV